MTEVIVFLITFTAAVLAIGVIAVSAAFVMYTKNYESKTKSRDMSRWEES